VAVFRVDGIAVAERLRITATTLNGILTVKRQGREQIAR